MHKASGGAQFKRPAFQLYPESWRADVQLGACDYVSRGVWWEMICVMHGCTPYGHLALNGKAMPDKQAAEACRVPLVIYRKALKDLETHGVFSRTAEGIIYSRRMVRDEHLRNVRAAAGKQGGNPALKVNGKDMHGG